MSAKNSDKKNKKSENFNIQNAYSSDEGADESWFSNGLHRFIIIFSVVYFGIVIVYITKFYGWDNLFSMLPNEFSGFMAGIILPIAIVWVVMAYIDRGSNFKHETQMLRDSLNQVIFPESGGNAASKMIADAIKNQVAELKDVTRDACAQADVIKRDLTDRVSDLRQLVSALDSYSSQAMQDLNEEVKKLIDNFSFVADKAATVSSDFRVNSMQMKDDSEKLVSIVKPMVNEMVTAAERVKEVVDVSNTNIEKAQSQLRDYSETSQVAIGRIIESWAEKGENLEKTFLRTAENCEELFRRLDSGISHIENSVAEQKAVVDKQSDLLDKNTVYLDSKLGEYGKLISLEVEAMIERSGTLEHNLQSQMNGIRNSADDVVELFNKLGSSISDKRKMIEGETVKITDNIRNTMHMLNEETQHLKNFYKSSGENNEAFDKILHDVSDKLREVELGLNMSVSTFGEYSEKMISKLQKTGESLAQNLNNVAQNSETMREQSKSNVELLLEQDEYINKAMAKLQQIGTGLSTINKDLNKAGVNIGSTLDKYETKMLDFGKSLNLQLNELEQSYEKTKLQLDKINISNVDSFMRDSATVLAELETLSIDITNIFNRKNEEEELWKKYYAGDHGAFTRYLAKNITKKEVKSLQDSYEKKADFRVVVDKYMEDFEALIAAAKDNARSGTVLALISGSDIGKVYYIMARALGKIQ
ncbi:MAG: hypothetical protein IKO06_05430 [Alphaproteobacteria bacterium]|nr:hypothetical protein [Alphaproteobacteria bacterium]